MNERPVQDGILSKFLVVLPRCHCVTEIVSTFPLAKFLLYVLLACHSENVLGMPLNSPFSVPCVEDVTKRAGRVLDEFKDLVYPADYVPGQKRKQVRFIGGL